MRTAFLMALLASTIALAAPPRRESTFDLKNQGSKVEIVLELDAVEWAADVARLSDNWGWQSLVGDPPRPNPETAEEFVARRVFQVVLDLFDAVEESYVGNNSVEVMRETKGKRKAKKKD